MRFGTIAVADCAGAILAHSRKVAGRTLKKGRVLSAEDVAALMAVGVETVTAAQLDPKDVREDMAADLIAEACRGAGLEKTASFTGRANLFAATSGVAVVDRGRLDRLNAVDERITVATLSPYDVVHPRQLVATVKIIPFAVEASVVDACDTIAREGGTPIARVAEFRARRVGLIQTHLDGTKEKVLNKTTAVTRDRLARAGSDLAMERRCAHDAGALAVQIAELRRAGMEIILINGASAIVDRRDVIPAAIEAAGGEIEQFGMPVDPGNLILSGRLGAVPVLGLPGCARSPKLNGFDWVLERLLAGLAVGRGDIMAMGVGGLLKEIPSRGLPRAEAAPCAAAPSVPHIGAILLGAGQSRRMGAINKLLAEIDGAPMIARALDATLASSVAPVVVVTGHEADRVRAALADRDVTFAHNPDYAEGLSTSLAAGLASLPNDCDGVVICLGDMPRIKSGHIDRLVAAFDPVEGRAICVPTWRGKRGNPVLFARRFLTEMVDVRGDVGARHLIGEYEDLVAEVAMEDDGVMIDVDSPQALTAVLTGKPVPQ